MVICRYCNRSIQYNPYTGGYFHVGPGTCTNLFHRPKD